MDELTEIRKMEQELRDCLQHVDVPAGFTERVMARLSECEPARLHVIVQGPRKFVGGLSQMVHSRAAWWTAAAAALALAAGSGELLHVRHQRHQIAAAQAQAQMDLAMQLTNHALNEVQGGFDRSSAGRFATLWNGNR